MNPPLNKEQATIWFYLALGTALGGLGLYFFSLYYVDVAVIENPCEACKEVAPRIIPCLYPAKPSAFLNLSGGNYIGNITLSGKIR